MPLITSELNVGDLVTVVRWKTPFLNRSYQGDVLEVKYINSPFVVFNFRLDCDFMNSNHGTVTLSLTEVDLVRVTPEYVDAHEAPGISEDKIEALAGVLYDTYCDAVGGKAFNGDLLPSWSVFRAEAAKALQSNAWVAVARRAVLVNNF